MFKFIYPEFWNTKNPISYLLWPLSLVYQLISYLRSIFTTKSKLVQKVICVGNVSVGGTGKTQVVIQIAKILKKGNVRFLIITKAYGSKLKRGLVVDKNHSYLEVGDESLELSKYGTVIASKNIKEVISLVKSFKPKVEVLIMDDGMQNSSLYKDVNILVIDGDRQLGNNFLLPAGPLRSNFVKALQEINALIVVDNLYRPYTIENFFKPIFKAKITANIKKKIDKTKTYLAFCGIGNPKRFFNLLEDYGLNLIKCKSYPDHYTYSNQDLVEIKNQADNLGSYLITTRKDYIRIGKKIPVIPFDVTLNIKNYSSFTNLLYEKIFKKDQI